MLKFLSDKIPTIPLVFIIYAAAALAAFAAILKGGGFPKIPLNLTAIAILTGAIVVIGYVAFALAFKNGPAVKVMPIVNLNTIITVGMAILLLNEKMTPKIGLGIAFAIISIYLLTS